MRRLGIVVVVVGAVACGTTPTTPSAVVSMGTAVLATQADRPDDHTPGTKAVTIYFNARELPLYGHYHLTGLPVHLTGYPSNWTYLEYTGKQGTVKADFPKTDTSVHVQTELWNGWCPEQQDVPIPYVPRENWVNMHTGDCSGHQ
jgi:hypothetical protein